MRHRIAFFLASGVMLLLAGSPAWGQAPPAYANVEVVSIDPLTRHVVIRNSKGAREVLDFDDGLAGLSGITPGDNVMIAMRGEPGRTRITAITKLAPTSGPARVSPGPSPTPLPPSELPRAEVRARFTEQVATLAQQARPIDGMWSSFVTTCNAKQSSSVTDGRDWFGIWDKRVTADLSNGFCRDLFNQIVRSGESVKKGMAAAEDVARKTLSVGEIRDIKKLNAMDWDGWGLAAPAKLEP